MNEIKQLIEEGGADRISPALLRLSEADQYVRRQSPDWSGDNRDHDGVTAYSLAEWFRRRDSFGRVVHAAGFFDDGEARVIIVAEAPSSPEDDLTFTGLSWGYGGEGPSGLAAVLTDAGFFASLDEARVWIAGQDFEGVWELSR